MAVKTPEGRSEIYEPERVQQRKRMPPDETFAGSGICGSSEMRRFLGVVFNLYGDGLG